MGVLKLDTYSIQIYLLPLLYMLILSTDRQRDVGQNNLSLLLGITEPVALAVGRFPGDYSQISGETNPYKSSAASAYPRPAYRPTSESRLVIDSPLCTWSQPSLRSSPPNRSILTLLPSPSILICRRHSNGRKKAFFGVFLLRRIPPRSVGVREVPGRERRLYAASVYGLENRK